MEVPELPECPVCLNPYDAVSSVPRVLSCGHSTCEVCISQLPNPFPNTIRCPSCTQIVKLPGRPSSLPKNIDLLRLSSSLVHPHHPPDDRPKKVTPREESAPQLNPFMPTLWSREFYLNWKNWVLPNDCVLVERTDSQEDGLFGLSYGKIVRNVDNFDVRCILRENEKVGLVKVGVFRDQSERQDGKEGVLCSKFKYSYEAKIVKVLFLMKENERDELEMILKESLKIKRVGKICGFWCNEEDNGVFMVFERFSRGLAKSTWELEEGFLAKIEEEGHKVSKMGGFGLIGMEICEVVNDLHVEGFVLGCLSVHCFGLDEFGRVFIDFGEVLGVGRRVCRAISGNEELENELFKKFAFVSPEVVIESLRNQGIELGDGSLEYKVGFGSDVWSLACVLIWLLAGKSFSEEMNNYCKCLFSTVNDQKGCNYVDLYMGWKEKIAGLLEGGLRLGFASLKDMLCKCLEFDPGSRPVLIEVWKCIRKLTILPELDISLEPEIDAIRRIPSHCILFGNLCDSSMKSKKGRSRHVAGGSLRRDENEVEGLTVDGDVNGLSNGHAQCINLKGHLDCISGLAVGGGFLFSSAHDKIVNVWSLQDFSHVHSFRSHEHRVTAVVFVDEGEPLCISADNGGVICIWSAKFPLDTAPIRKLFEEKDWRFSGIQALAVSGNGCLYTGSGSRSIKAWSLQDYSLMCTMTGHKSIVSSLAVSNGILYSGSWDGTVRLWSLNDHTPLAVLEDERPNALSPVRCLVVDGNLLLVAQENGYVMMWYNDVLVKSSQVQNGVLFSINKSGKWLFTGGWDKTVSVLELSGDGTQTEATLTGSVSVDSIVTALVYWEGKLFVGQANGALKVCYSGL
ncbi:uncharacterized protein LOC113748960 [Coffea eugenioides]|uniref:uncharacterized protein LOC113748960 n=1 Tax=Coffea eugenioides TaxID=49369 RepID=UPI000F6088E3|nr:uncharacterized protein LOC113748960 [Coffea eugenioides]